MSFLRTILAEKQEEVLARKKSTPLSALEQMRHFGRGTLSLSEVLKGKRIAVIAEIKKASPSKGVLREDFDPLGMAKAYVEAGASAISVLTDSKFFQGRLENIRDIREVVAIPLLRKDFVIDEYQIYESKAYGADAILLIASALQQHQLSDFILMSSELGLECLVEVHTKEEIDSLDFSCVKMVGINNRDLTTFKTNLSTSFRLRKHIPPHVIVVSESGIRSRHDLDRLVSNGIHAVLVGESLVRAENPGRALAELLVDEMRVSS